MKFLGTVIKCKNLKMHLLENQETPKLIKNFNNSFVMCLVLECFSIIHNLLVIYIHFANLIVFRCETLNFKGISAWFCENTNLLRILKCNKWKTFFFNNATITFKKIPFQKNRKTTFNHQKLHDCTLKHNFSKTLRLFASQVPVWPICALQNVLLLSCI